MFSSIDMTPEIKTGFSNVKEYILTKHADWLNFQLLSWISNAFKNNLGLSKTRAENFRVVDIEMNA